MRCICGKSISWTKAMCASCAEDMQKLADIFERNVPLEHTCSEGCTQQELGDVWKDASGRLFHNHNGVQHEVWHFNQLIECTGCGNVGDCVCDEGSCYDDNDWPVREKLDDDGVEYADPRDYKAGLE